MKKNCKYLKGISFVDSMGLKEIRKRICMNKEQIQN